MPARMDKDGKFQKREKIDKDKKENNKDAKKMEDDGEAVAGYGLPTKGSYDPSVGGYKAFGTVGQGDEAIGMHDKNDTKCEKRRLLVTVTAVEANSTNITNSTNSTNPQVLTLLETDPSGGQVDIEFGSGAFAGAIILSSSVVVSLAAVALALY